MLTFTKEEIEYMASCPLTFYTASSLSSMYTKAAGVNYLHNVPASGNCLSDGSMLFWSCNTPTGFSLRVNRYPELLSLAMSCNFDKAVTVTADCGEAWLHDALCARTREELESLKNVSWSEKSKKAHTYTDGTGSRVIRPDASIVAEWRLEHDIGVPALTPVNPSEAVLSATLSKKDLLELVLEYETEAGESMRMLGNLDYYSNMVYHRFCSNLYWGLVYFLKDQRDYTVREFLGMCKLPKEVPGTRGNTDRGYAWFLEALTTASADKLSEYLLTNWSDYQEGFTGGLIPYTGGPRMAFGKHPVRPDSYIVARWRLESGIAI